MVKYQSQFKGALDESPSGMTAMGVREGGKWYYEVRKKGLENTKSAQKVGPFESLEAAKSAAKAKGYDW